MSKTFTLVTAVLMTMAALVWGVSLFTVVRATGSWPIMNVIVFLAFAALAAIYWSIYVRRKNTLEPGTK